MTASLPVDGWDQDVVAPPALSQPAEADLRRLLLIRHFEWRLQTLFEEGRLAGTTHTCLGQEYVPVAVSALLRADDFIFSNHRGHGHYLARFADPAGLLAELMGRAGAVCGGVGGSQHIRRGRFVSTGVQGQSLPVAVGAALHLQRSGAAGLACVYIGDGTWGEGAVYEALNLAALWRLPLLVVVEHNGIAQTTPTRLQMAGTIAGRARAFGLAHVRVDDIDVNRIRSVVGPFVEQVRNAGRPTVVEFRTHRLGPHSTGRDTRPPQMRRAAERYDWYELYRAAFPQQFRTLDDEQRSTVLAVAAEVAARPPAGWVA
ncbi:thiamine pyrophosphate-dependent dehydrogenase E1 component subunit alpha [Dactylosporangium sp. CA-139066]|uniref:thiamine pyrophosphate-dependent dehydrogenase E1 component subunit alpha n=1 Tax=Dactylosporangium sp. CA-139066 TaxID=3239930 RepID=UPI003D8D56AC